MSFIEIFILFVVMAGLALVPSTSVALIVTRSAYGGFSSGSAVAAGIVVGDLIFVFLAVFGMSALAEVVCGFFLILRYLAGAYLIWFGISLMKSKILFSVKDSGGLSFKRSESFFAGLLITLADVKAIFFYASLFPAFIDLARITALDIAIIALITIVAVGGIKLAYAYFAMHIARYSIGHKTGRTVKKSVGSLLVGAGAYLIAKT